MQTSRTRRPKQMNTFNTLTILLFCSLSRIYAAPALSTPINKFISITIKDCMVHPVKAHCPSIREATSHSQAKLLLVLPSGCIGKGLNSPSAGSPLQSIFKIVDFIYSSQTFKKIKWYCCFTMQSVVLLALQHIQPVCLSNPPGRTVASYQTIKLRV